MKHTPEWFAARWERKYPGIVAALRDAALSSAEIGRRFGISRRLVRVMRHEIQPDIQRRPYREHVAVGPEEYQARLAGSSWDQIAMDMGLLRGAHACARAKSWAKRNGLPWPPGQVDGRKPHRKHVAVGPEEYQARLAGSTWDQIARDRGLLIGAHACIRAKSWARRNGLPWPPAPAEGRS